MKKPQITVTTSVTLSCFGWDTADATLADIDRWAAAVRTKFGEDPEKYKVILGQSCLIATDS